MCLADTYEASRVHVLLLSDLSVRCCIQARRDATVLSKRLKMVVVGHVPESGKWRLIQKDQHFAGIHC